VHAQNISYEAAHAIVAAEVQANCQGGYTGRAAARQVFKNSGISPNAIVSAGVVPENVCQTLTTSTYGASSLQEVEVTVVAKAQDKAPVLGLPSFTTNITAEATLPLEIGNEKSNESGQAIVELVIILLLLILLVAGFLQIYIDIHASDVASQAARA
jgi:hypothetical protein